jgi:hypothetical protein|tara:strand:+ start:207 stop:350 length:144 start_codon:yes stop_codon:yes gene_type:complete
LIKKEEILDQEIKIKETVLGQEITMGIVQTVIFNLMGIAMALGATAQ